MGGGFGGPGSFDDDRSEQRPADHEVELQETHEEEAVPPADGLLQGRDGLGGQEQRRKKSQSQKRTQDRGRGWGEARRNADRETGKQKLLGRGNAVDTHYPFF